MQLGFGLDNYKYKGLLLANWNFLKKLSNLYYLRKLNFQFKKFKILKVFLGLIVRNLHHNTI